MVFQSLLSTAVGAIGGGSGVMGAACIVPSAGFNGKQEKTPVKVRQAWDLNCVRTFNDLPSGVSHRRPGEDDDGVGLEEALCAWQSAAEIEPLCRGNQKTQSNYGTFSRKSCLFSSAVEDKLTVFRDKCKAAPEDMSDTVSRASTATARSDEHTCFVRHELQSSDTLGSLALKYNVTVNDIIRANGASGTSHNALLVRKFLQIPVLVESPEGAGSVANSDSDSEGDEDTERA
mmetsp:Transcript_1551/g.2537  ORF Transcript_1551/g.2537 Transcript_1551/m.2537 type:complete len:232 (+) Transcript_1551:391-1086(+)